MTFRFASLKPQAHRLAACALAWLSLAAPTHLAWAHGPDGDHDHAAAPTKQSVAPSVTAPATPPAAAEARSEAFELVASLDGGELSVLIDRFDTNEPVLGAVVQVSLRGIQADATFHADHGAGFRHPGPGSR